MPSAIDPTQPADGGNASKAQLRASLRAARDELGHGGFLPPYAGAEAAVEVTVAEMLAAGSFVDPRRFGASGVNRPFGPWDDLPDSFAALQEAIFWAEANNHLLLLPALTFATSKPLEFGRFGVPRILGMGKDCTVVVGAPGADVFRHFDAADRRTFGNAAGIFGEMTIIVDNSVDARATLSRCTPGGVPCGNAGIAFQSPVDQYRTYRDVDLPDFQRLMTFRGIKFAGSSYLRDGNSPRGQVGVYCEGGLYGARFYDMTTMRDMSGAYTEMLPQVRRVQDAGTGLLRTAGNTPYADGTQVMLLAAAGSGVDGVTLRRPYRVARDGAAIGLRAIQADGSAGGRVPVGRLRGTVYVSLAGPDAGEFAPDQHNWGVWESFARDFGFCFVNHFNSSLGHLIAYGPKHQAVGMWSLRSRNRMRAEHVWFDNIYAEGPLPDGHRSDDHYVLLQGRHLRVGTGPYIAMVGDGEPPQLTLDGLHVDVGSLNLTEGRQSLDFARAPRIVLRGDHHRVRGEAFVTATVVDQGGRRFSPHDPAKGFDDDPERFDLGHSQLYLTKKGYGTDGAPMALNTTVMQSGRLLVADQRGRLREVG